MRRLAARLGAPVAPDRWPALVRAAEFDSMRTRVDDLAPDADGILKDKRAFFRQGRSGVGAQTLSQAELEHYYQRVGSMAPPDVLQWLHRTPPFGSTSAG
jgi:aryl sulfotransferase